MHKTILAVALAVIGALPQAARGVDLTQYLRRETFTDIKISPGAST